MPIKNGKVFCINHPTVAMTRNRGFNAITTFQRTGSSFEFNPLTGMPLVAYYCNECGYVETYAAQKTQFWSEIADSVDPSTSYRLFESTIRNALENLTLAKSIEQNLRISRDGITAEIDILMRTPETIYVFEVKARLSPENANLAARQVIRAAKTFEETIETTQSVVPMIIVAKGDIPYDEVEGVKVLKFDLGALRFTNPEVLGLQSLISS
jgi:Holliday junction resolvase-like predicted endonuclease